MHYFCQVSTTRKRIASRCWNDVVFVSTKLIHSFENAVLILDGYFFHGCFFIVLWSTLRNQNEFFLQQCKVFIQIIVHFLLNSFHWLQFREKMQKYYFTTVCFWRGDSSRFFDHEEIAWLSATSRNFHGTFTCRMIIQWYHFSFYRWRRGIIGCYS